MEAVLQRKLCYLLNNLSLQEEDLRKLQEKGIITRTVQRELAADDDPLATIRTLFTLVKENRMSEEAFLKMLEEVDYEVSTELRTEMDHDKGQLEVEKAVKDESGFVVRRESLLNRRMSENQKRAITNLVAKRTQYMLTTCQRNYEHLQRQIAEQRSIERRLDGASQRMQDKNHRFIKGSSPGTFDIDSLQDEYRFKFNRYFELESPKEPQEELHKSINGMLVFSDMKYGELTEKLTEKEAFLQHLKHLGVKSQAMDKAVEEAMAYLVKENLYNEYRNERLAREMEDLIATKYIHLWRKRVRQIKTRRETKEIRREIAENEEKAQEEEDYHMKIKNDVMECQRELKSQCERTKELRKSKALTLMYERDLQKTLRKREDIQRHRRSRSTPTATSFRTTSYIRVPGAARPHGNTETISYRSFQNGSSGHVYGRRGRSRNAGISLDPPRLAFQLTDDEERPHTSHSVSSDITDFRSEVSLSRRDSGHGSVDNSSPEDGRMSPLVKNNSGSSGQLSSPSMVNYDFQYMYGKPVRRRTPVSSSPVSPRQNISSRRGTPQQVSPRQASVRPKTSRSRAKKVNTPDLELTSSKVNVRPASVNPAQLRRRGASKKPLLQTL